MCFCDDWPDYAPDDGTHQLDLFEWQPVPTPRIGPPLTLSNLDAILAKQYTPYLRDDVFQSKILLDAFPKRLMPRTVKTILNRPPKQKPGVMPTGKAGTKPGKTC